MRSSLFISQSPTLRVGAPSSDADAAGPFQVVCEVCARVLIVALFAWMAVRFGVAFFETGRVTGLFLLVSEGLVALLTVFRRSATDIDVSVRARALMTASLVGPALLVPIASDGWTPEWFTVAMSCFGLSIVIAGKLALGRSFALLPANRGVVSSGVYRFVRHPIYLGYLVSHIAFLVANPTVWNALVLVAGDVALLCRSVCEEETLAKDSRYRAYQSQVQWRVVPGVF